MTREEYQSAILLSVLRQAKEPQRARDLLESAVSLAMEHGATSAHLAGLNGRTIAGRLRALGDKVSYDAGTDCFEATETRVLFVPIPPSMPDRSITAPRPRRGRRHDPGTVAAQALLAPCVRIAPADNDDMREFAEDAGRALLRIAREVKALQRKYRKIALGGGP